MASESLTQIIETFQSADPELRLEFLLDYARTLPALPERLRGAGELAERGCPSARRRRSCL